MTAVSVPPPTASRNKVAVFLDAIKFEHTIFALPFAYLGMILAARGLPSFVQFAWITVAMASARTFAMTLNRLIDRVSGIALAVAASQLNDLCLILMPGAVVLLTLYSFTKRFTWLCHFVLGCSIALAPIGAWVGVTGAVTTEPLLLGLAVVFWLAGFDIIYACQDIDVDRQQGLFSVPSRFGLARGLQIARACHVVTIIFFGAVGVVCGLGVTYWVGVMGAAGLLIYEHSIVSPDDLS
ncbi:MAG: 4-hydroxybenzoate octaprenyltransferase, partial [Chloroflexi bacterium]|nr:4-hydroxybenzoate octaprenyltransferase [Chloroflexota bacterium]